LLRVRRKTDLSIWMKLEPLGELRPRDGLRSALLTSFEIPEDGYWERDDGDALRALLDRLREIG